MDLKTKSFLIIILSCLLTGFSYSQEYQMHRHYNLQDGLPSSQIYQMMKDSRGNIWFGSDYGVTCFNGQEFRTFTVDDGLTDNTVLNCFEDSKGRIWFNHVGNLPSYFYEGQIFSLEYQGSIPVISPISRFVESSNGNVYIGAQSGVLEITKSGTCRFIELAPGHAFDFSHNEDGMIYFLAKNHLSESLPLVSRNIYGTYDKLKLSVQLTSSCILRSYPDLRRMLNKKKLPISILEDMEDAILIRYRDDKIYSCSDAGLKIYSVSGNRKILDTILNAENTISSVLFDEDQGLWLGTLSDGVFHYDKKKYRLLNPTNDRISTLAFNNGKIYTGSLKGMVYEVNDDKLSALGNMAALYDIKPEIKGIFPFGQNNLIQTHVGLVKMKLGSPNIEYSILFPSFASSIVQLSNGSLLFSSLGGMFNFYKDSSYRVSNNDLYVGRAYDIVRENKNIYIATATGLYKMNETESGLTSPEYFKKEIFKGVRVNDLLMKDGALLIGTSKYGLYMIDREVTYNFTTANGLLTNRINKIVPSEYGGFWLVSDLGLQLVDFDKGKLVERRRLDIKTILNTTDIEDLVQIRSNLYVLTNFGLYLFNIADVTQPSKMEVNLFDIKVNGTSRNVQNKRIDVESSERNINLEVSSVNFTNSPSSYFLQINNDPWIESKNGRFNLSSLAPGSYKAKIYANSAYLLPSDVLELDIVVQYPPWQSPWFIFVLCLLVVGGLSTLIFWYFNRRYQYKKRVTSLELQSLQAQMNPHFTFNTMNSIQNFILKNDKRSSLDYLSKFSQLMRRILEQSRIQLVPIRSEKEFLKTYIELEQNRMNHSFDFEIKLAPAIEEDRMGVPSMLLQPFVENAIWHGLSDLDYPGKLEIEFDVEEEKTLICIVRDNGKGREAAKQFKRHKKHRSRGMSITEDRIRLFQELYKTRINFIIEDVNSKRESGTKVRVELPILTVKPQENEE